MEIISSYNGPILPPKEEGGERCIKDEPLPLYPHVLLVQKLEGEHAREIVISDDVEYKIIEALKAKNIRVRTIDELKEEYMTDSVSGVITEMMRRNFCDDNKAHYLNSSWCMYQFANSKKWAASDAYIFNPYPRDTILTRTEKRSDYYCKFFVRAKKFFLTGVSFHEVRDEYNGVKRL